MSQENVELAREVLHALGTRDPDRLIALSDPEVEWHSFFAIGEGGGTYRGHDGTRRLESESPTGWMLKFRNGKVLCFRAFREPEQALEALGLSE